MLGFKKRFGFDNSLILKYNPVNEKIILEKSKESINEIKLNDSFKIVTVGRLVYEKGYDRLLKIHKSLIDNGFKHELWVVGDGNQRSQLEEYINKNNLKESVKLLGFNANPYKFMKNADLFVCSSRVEGLSTVVMEALICGTPVISTNCAGAMDLLGDSLYGVISENNEDALYETIKDMVLNKSKLNFFRAKSIQRGMDFTLERAISEIDNIFENCL